MAVRSGTLLPHGPSPFASSRISVVSMRWPLHSAQCFSPSESLPCLLNDLLALVCVSGTLKMRFDSAISYVPVLSVPGYPCSSGPDVGSRRIFLMCARRYQLRRCVLGLKVADYSHYRGSLQRVVGV